MTTGEPLPQNTVYLWNSENEPLLRSKSDFIILGSLKQRPLISTADRKSKLIGCGFGLALILLVILPMVNEWRWLVLQRSGLPVEATVTDLRTIYDEGNYYYVLYRFTIPGQDLVYENQVSIDPCSTIQSSLEHRLRCAICLQIHPYLIFGSSPPPFQFSRY
jgi:hypothetical protein